MHLSKLATLIRSKNAGPFSLTFDIVFDDKENYYRVRNSGVLTAEEFAKRFNVSHNQVRFFVCDNALAFKFTIPRPLSAGHPADGDLHGGQQFAPLMEIEIP